MKIKKALVSNRKIKVQLKVVGGKRDRDIPAPDAARTSARCAGAKIGIRHQEKLYPG